MRQFLYESIVCVFSCFYFFVHFKAKITLNFLASEFGIPLMMNVDMGQQMNDPCMFNEIKQ